MFLSLQMQQLQKENANLRDASNRMADVLSNMTNAAGEGFISSPGQKMSSPSEAMTYGGVADESRMKIENIPDE